MRDIKYLKINSEKLANSIKERSLFRNQRKAVNAGANGTLEYTIKEGVNKAKIADSMLIKNKKYFLIFFLTAVIHIKLNWVRCVF